MTTRHVDHITAAVAVRHGQLPFATEILKSLDNLMPIGMAFEAGRTEGYPAVVTVCQAERTGSPAR